MQSTSPVFLYARSGKENTYIDILSGVSGFVPEKGKSYVLNGSFINTAAGATDEYPMNGFVVFRVESFLSSDDLPYAEYTKDGVIPEIFLRAADQYWIMNNFVHVVPCRNVNDVYAFQQNELYLAEGVFPDPGIPYSCVISSDLAVRAELKPGDTFSLDELRGTSEDRYNLSRTGNTQAFTVSGKNSWLTGTAAWMWLTVSQYILGIKPDYDGLLIDPCVPNTAQEFSVKRKFREAEYRIRISNPQGVNRGVLTVEVDGALIDGNVIPYSPGSHEVTVIMG